MEGAQFTCMHDGTMLPVLGKVMHTLVSFVETRDFHSADKLAMPALRVHAWPGDEPIEAQRKTACIAA